MSSDSSPVYGDSTVLTAWVYGIAPTGTVVFRDGGTTLATATVTSGRATYSIDSLSVGSHSYSAQYSGDSSNAAASNSLTVSVAKAQPAFTTGSPSPADGSATLMVGAAANLSAKDLPADATGSIAFSDGSTALCSAALSAGRASCSTTLLPLGGSTVTAAYSGDANYLAASVASSANVQKATSSVTVASPTPASGSTALTLGSAATLTAGGLAANATGTVAFTDGSLTLCSAAVASGQASCSTSLLPVGASTVTAAYSGDGTYLGSSATASANVAKAPVQGASAAAAGPDTGTTRTFTFSSKGFPAAATGTVTFLFGTGATPLCQATLTGGAASCVAAVPGAGTVVASYAGDSSYAAFSLAGISVTPSKAVSILSLEAPAGDVTAAVGDQIAFAASLGTSASDAVTPTGTVTFFIGNRPACTDSISAGEASCDATVLATDSGVLSAAYAGNATTARATATGGSLVLAAPVQTTTTQPVQTTTTTPTTTTSAPATTSVSTTTTPVSSTTTTTTPTTTTTQTTTTASKPGRALVIDMHAQPGASAAGAPLTVSGSGLEPGSTVEVVVHSTPTLLGRVTVGADGSFSQQFALPAGLPAGSHHLIVSGTSANGDPVTQIASFAVDPQGRFGVPTQPPATTVAAAPSTPTSTTTPQAPAPAAATPAVAAPPLPTFQPRQHPKAVVGSIAGGIALLSVLGAAGAAGAAGSGQRGSQREKDEEIAKPVALPFLMLTSIKKKNDRLRWEGEAPGDASWTWRLPGRATIDRLSLALPVRLAPIAPLGARLLGDANYLRAVIGSASVALSVAALGLGVAASVSTGASAVTPALGFVIALVVIGVLDGLAGFVAAVAYAVGVAVQGGIDSTSAVRTILGVSALWFAVPLIAAAARPFRRPIEDLGVDDLWTHTADLVIAALAGAWATQKIIGALPLLSGVVPPLVASENTVAIVVLGAIGARFVLETAAAVLYPRRLTEVQPVELPTSSRRQRLLSLVLRTSLFLFVAEAFLGQCWELYAGAAIFAIPQVLRIFESRFPRSQRVAILVPGGIVKTVLMLFVGAWFFSEFHHRLSSTHLLTYGFVILGLPAIVFALLELIGRDGQGRKETWLQRLLGLGILILGVLFVFGRVT